jgi:hypothetical protein
MDLLVDEAGCAPLLILAKEAAKWMRWYNWGGGGGGGGCQLEMQYYKTKIEQRQSEIVT